MAFARGADAIERAAARKGGKFAPVLRWSDKEVKYLQFLQPLEEWVTVLMHPFVWVEADNEDGRKPEMFISRRDPELDGDRGYDPLITRFRENPAFRTITLAVELKQKGKGKTASYTVATRQYEDRSGAVKEVPAVGLIIQSPHNFAKHFKAQADEGLDILGHVWSVTRQGASTDTQYTPTPLSQEADLSDIDEFLEEFDFDAYLEDLASEQRMRDKIDTLPDNWVVNDYAKKDRDGKKDKPSRGTTRRRSAPEPEADAEESGESDESGEDKKTSDGPSKYRRFASLREEMGH